MGKPKNTKAQRHAVAPWEQEEFDPNKAHPYKRDPERDPNLENCPHRTQEPRKPKSLTLQKAVNQTLNSNLNPTLRVQGSA